MAQNINNDYIDPSLVSVIGSNILTKTNGSDNSVQSVLNLAAGSNISLSETSGTVTINSTSSGSGGGSNVDVSFEVITYSPILNVTYNGLRPNKHITLTGNLNLSLNSTVNGNAGIVYIVRTNQTVTLNGTTVSVLPSTGNLTLTYLNILGQLNWYLNA